MKMEVFQYRPWRILSKCEQYIGYWPYDSNHFSTALYSVIIVTRILPVIINLVKTIHKNLGATLECIIGIAILVVVLIKLIVPWAKRNCKERIYEKIREHVRRTTDLEEAQILKDCYDEGWRFSVKYLIVTFSSTGVYQITPIAEKHLDHFFNNVTLEKTLPVPVDYLIDQEKYFYPILMHIYLGVFVVVFAEITFNLSFILTIRHICGLFKIVSMRVQKTVELLNSADNNSMVRETDAWIKSIVDCHNEASELVTLMEENVSVTCFIILIMNSAIFSASYFIRFWLYRKRAILESFVRLQITIHLDDGYKLFRYSFLFMLIFSHFYLVFSQGQKIIDSSSSVFDACCDCQWYTLSMKMRILLYTVMIRSSRPNKLTGGDFFILSMETYCKMLKTGLSFYTVYGSIED